MKKPNDEIEKALQEWLEEGKANNENLPPFDQQEVADYEQIFNVLKEKPAVMLASDFSEIVVASLQARQHQFADFRWYFALAGVIVGLLGLTYVVLFYGNSAWAEKFIQLLFTHRWHLVFASVCFLIIQYLDLRFWTHSVRRSSVYA